MNNAIQLTEEEATRLCLRRDLSLPSSVKVLILVGEDESPAFIKQSENLFLERKQQNGECRSENRERRGQFFYY